MRTLTKIFSAMLMILTAVSVHRAQQSIHSGIDLYKSSNYVSAITALSSAVSTKEFKANGEMWNYLGLAYMATKENKKAVKSFEKAAKLDASKGAYRANLAYAHFSLGKFKKAASESEKAIAIDPSSVTAYSIRGLASFQLGKFDIAENDADRVLQLDRTVASAYVLKSRVAMERLKKRLAAGSSMKKEVELLLSIKELLAAGKDLSKNTSDYDALNEEYDAISAFYSYFSEKQAESTTDPLVPEPNVTPLRILKKVPARYTDAARQSNVQGTIKMAVLFAADGKVKHILVLSRLGKGLDENALTAARGIIFEPMTRDGKPVSVVRIIEYTFSIY
ncbi:MAG: tetratricopeptide repeat protein [Pyrinomonadaceae bacterium]